MSEPLVARYAAVVCDLDGVVYRGPSPVPHAVESLGALDVPVIFATNNASRTSGDVADHLGELGLDCSADDVATSAQAAAWILSRRLPAGAHVLAVGGAGVAAALEDAGLTAVSPRQADTVSVRAVVQGYGAAVCAADLGEASYAIEHGARWVATNTDLTLPTDRGLAPGNGSLVAAVATAVGHEPHEVAGKPESPLYELCAARLGTDADRVLAVGDRLSTDIAGAVAAGMDSLLVLTGVDDLDAVLDAGPDRRPTHVAVDLRSLLLTPGRAPDGAPSVADLGAAVARVHTALDDGADGIEDLRQAARDVLDAARRG